MHYKPTIQSVKCTFSHAWEPQILQQPQVNRRQVGRQSTRIRHHYQPFPNPWHWARALKRNGLCRTAYAWACTPPPPSILHVRIPCCLKGVANTPPRATQNLPPFWVPPVTIALGPQGCRAWEWGSMGVVGRCTETEQNARPENMWAKKTVQQPGLGPQRGVLCGLCHLCVTPILIIGGGPPPHPKHHPDT